MTIKIKPESIGRYTEIVDWPALDFAGQPYDKMNATTIGIHLPDGERGFVVVQSGQDTGDLQFEVDQPRKKADK